MTTWLAWGASFPFISLTVHDLPPLAAMGARFITAALVLLALAAGRGELSPATPAALRSPLVAGTGLVAVGMGLTAWSEQSIPAGTAALVAASAPLWMSISARILFGQRLGIRAALGVAIGLCGVSVLVGPAILGGSPSTDPYALGLMILSAVAWGVTSQLASRMESPLGLLQGTAVQLGWGGLLLVVAAAIRGERAGAAIASLDLVTLFAWGFLVVVAGVVAYSAYAWLLANTSARLASTHAFVNPVVALSLSSLLLGEQIGASAAAAALLVTVAVVLLGGAPGDQPSRYRTDD